MATVAAPKGKQYKTVLKVCSQCACEGCKGRVQKISTIKGVLTVDIDLERQIVIVKGYIDSKTLIEELKKTTSKRYELMRVRFD
ncbi:hypothetical protein SLA2020_387680 [Shorea laevis]